MQDTQNSRSVRRRDLDQVEKDIRCHCGKLVARWEANGLSIKCVRCQRLVSISYQQIEGLSYEFYSEINGKPEESSRELCSSDSMKSVPECMMTPHKEGISNIDPSSQKFSL